MFKAGDNILVVRLETTRRQRRKTELVKGGGDWITSKPKMVETKAVIGSLHALYIPVRLPDRSRKIKKVPYSDLKIGRASCRERV